MEKHQSNDHSSTDEPALQGNEMNVAPHLDELGQAILTGYSLKAYARLLAYDHGRAVAERLYNDTDNALKTLCKYETASVRFDEDPYEACVKIARLALSRYFDHSPSAIENSPQMTYMAYLSPSLPYLDLGNILTTETRIQEAIIIPATSLFSGNSTQFLPSASVDSRMDIPTLETMLKTHADDPNKKSALVVATVGSSVFGHNDLVTKLLTLRETYGFWLHLVGLNAAVLAATTSSENLLRVIKSADSVSLMLGRWIGLPHLPMITYIQTGSHPKTLYQREKLNSLPWWIVISHLKIDGIRSRIDAAFKTSAGVLKQILLHPSLVMPGLGSSAELLARIEKGTLMPPSVLTFRYTPILTQNDNAYIDQDYIDSLNVWLAQSLCNDCPFFRLQLVDLSLGAAIRFCPLELLPEINTSDSVRLFGHALRSTLNILDATIRAKERLVNIIAVKQPLLRLVKLTKWAGVGGLLYLPSMFRNQNAEGQPESMDQWNEIQKRQLSNFNIELVHALRGNDGAFTIGDCPEGLSCVKLGMLANDADLENLVSLITETGKEMEESSQFLESLAKVVRDGIQAANNDLRRENDERLMQEGVLRQVPLVSSLVNWWSPIQKEPTLRGRTFDLKTGQIHFTSEVVARRSESAEPEISGTLNTSNGEHDEASPKVEDNGHVSQQQ